MLLLLTCKELANLAVTHDEIEYLRSTCHYLSPSYLTFLEKFRLQPSQQVTLSFKPVEDRDETSDKGDLHIAIHGRWLDTILYEIPLLALTSEAFFRFCDRDWKHDGQEEKAYNKGIHLLENGCNFSEFGTRRRRDYHTMELVMQGLTRAAATAKEKGYKGNLAGTSNVHFAMRYGIPPVGTVAHEWFMGIASISNDYQHASETALRYWVGCFGEGVLSIALTDTFGTPTFLKAFKQHMPNIGEIEAQAESVTVLRPEAPRPAILDDKVIANLAQIDTSKLGDEEIHKRTKSYAETFSGVRQDSGDPLEFVKVMRKFYDEQGIKERKTIVFSDSLNVDKCLEYKAAAEAAGFSATFGIGTFFTNDFQHLSADKKSTPLNIVIKLSSASGRPAIKISDNIGKNTGDETTVHEVKEKLGYVENDWKEGDERKRWDGEVKA